MIKRTTTVQTYCDLCEQEKEIKTITTTVWFGTEETEGTNITPYLSQREFDICEDCAKKFINIKGRGAQGYNRYRGIRENRKV